MEEDAQVLYVCRFCAKERSIYGVDLFDDGEDEEGHTFFKVSKCIPIMISRHDRLPHKICMICLPKLKFCYEFIEKCKSANETLRAELDANDMQAAVVMTFEELCEPLLKAESQEDGEKNGECLENGKVVGENLDAVLVVNHDVGMVEGVKVKKKRIRKRKPKSAERDGTAENGNCVTIRVRKCLVCEVDFQNLGQLSSHLVSEHKTDCVCTVCDKQCSSSFGLAIHFETHTKKYECSQCQKKFRSSRLLSQHTNRHTKPPLVCDVCGKCITTAFSLVNHKRTHTKEKPFKCDMCDKTFSLRASLTTHLRNHLGDKPYQCDKCGVPFADLKAFKVHQRRHTGEKPYKCRFCGKRFRQRPGLTVHERVHTGQRTHWCAVCFKGFKQKSEYVGHMRKHKDVFS